ncbi:MAG: NADH-quinone oxidoreductase subunit L [Candidatus Methanomethylicia archaeon]
MFVLASMVLELNNIVQLTAYTWLIPFLGSTLILIFRNRRVIGLISIFSIFISFILSFLLLLDVYLNGSRDIILYSWIESFHACFGVYADALSSIVAVMVSWISFLIGVYSFKYMEGDEWWKRYWFFFTFFVGSMLLAVLARDLLTMLVGWEGTSLASYALIGHWFTDEEEKCVGDVGRKALGMKMWFTPSESGFRAIVMTGIADTGMLIGMGILLFLNGNIEFKALTEASGEWISRLYSLGILIPFLILLSLGSMGKSAQFPFHEWLVTAMTGPTSVSALIHAATMVKVGVYFMLRLAPIIILGSTISNISVKLFFEFIVLIGVFTAFFMATQAIVAREIKLVLAFSTASQLGYMFLAVGSSALIHEHYLGVLSGLTHMVSHAIFKASLFLAAGAVIHTIESKYMDDAGELSKGMKYTFLATLLGILSLAGIPPTLGFWSKDMIIEAAYESGCIPYWLSIVTAGLTAYYSFRYLFKIFIIKDKHKEEHIHEADLTMLTPYLLLGVLALATGMFWPIGGNLYVFLINNKYLGIEEDIHIPGLNAKNLLISCMFILTGFLAAYYSCIARRRVFELKGFTKTIYNLLYNRYLINSIYYLIFVEGFHKISRWTAEIENVLDKILHVEIVKNILGVALKTRKSMEFTDTLWYVIFVMVSIWLIVSLILLLI